MQTQQKDIYDLEVERLTREPELIMESWFAADTLFKFVGNGCLSMVHNIENERVYASINGVFNYQITDAIKRDNSLPSYGKDITPAHLPHFAKWQRRIDRVNAGESFEDVMREDAV